MQVLATTTLLDGSAVVELIMTREEIEVFAKIGLIEVLIEASKSYDTIDAEVVDNG